MNCVKFCVQVRVDKKNYKYQFGLCYEFFTYYPSRLKSQSSLVLKVFATVPSHTSTKVVSGVSSDGRTSFLRPGKKCFGPRICKLNLSLFISKL